MSFSELFPEFSTERTQLRTPRISDSKKLIDFYTENKTFFAPYDPPIPADFYTNDYWKEMIQLYQNNWIEGKELRFLLICLKSDEIMGMINFTQMARGPSQCCKLGYKLGKIFTGQGIMTESLRLTVQYIFQELNFHRIEAAYLSSNKASASVLERVGFSKEGVAQKYLFIDGSWQDHTLTSLTNNQWKEICS